MARALTAVGALLALAFIGFGLVVYLSRDEDLVAVDNLLSEQLTRALSTAEERGEEVVVADYTDFGWDRLLVVEPGTPAARITQALGSRFAGMESFDDGALLVFADGDRMVRYADYRGRGEFEGLPRPVAELRARGGGLPRTRPGDHPPAMTRLDELDLSLDLSKKEEAARLEAAQERLLELRLTLGGQIGAKELGPPLCVVFEGGDASGKGGAIKRLVDRLDPRHVRVAATAAPTHDEKRHHYLWRFWPLLPGWGGMAVLDRSWYGRVLVERVEGFAGEAEWSRAYDEINDFERSLVLEGMILVKFWLHVSPEEQLKRFEARAKDPLKQWKLTDEDWRNREKRPAYDAAVAEMVERTDTEWAPWDLVEADSKRWARVKVVETVVARVEAALAG